MSQGRLLRTVVEIPFGQSLASFSLREAVRDARAVPGALEAGLVLTSPGVVPFTLWARFLAGRGAEEDLSVTFHVSGVGMSGDYEASLPWAARGMYSWDGLTGWAGGAAEAIGHSAHAAREAAAFLAGIVLESVSDAWAASLVARACGMVAPDRVVELAREQAARQVMEG
jgi:hypothetical protein